MPDPSSMLSVSHWAKTSIWHHCMWSGCAVINTNIFWPHSNLELKFVAWVAVWKSCSGASYSAASFTKASERQFGYDYSNQCSWELLCSLRNLLGLLKKHALMRFQRETVKKCRLTSGEKYFILKTLVKIGKTANAPHILFICCLAVTH